METFFGRLKNEMFYGFEKDYPSFEAFSKAIVDYMKPIKNISATPIMRIAGLSFAMRPLTLPVCWRRGGNGKSPLNI